MSYTTIDEVRMQLLGASNAQRSIRNELLPVVRGQLAFLRNFPIISESVRVKGYFSYARKEYSVIFSDSNWIPFTSEGIVPGTVAVCDGVRIDKIYVEGYDYLIDYDNGSIRRLTQGSLREGDSVTIYLNLFVFFVVDSDYAVNPQLGAIELLSESKIPESWTVYVDYDMFESAVSDDLVAQAIAKAETIIEARLVSTSDSNSPLLVTGAMQLSCAMLARTLAARPLNESKGSQTEGRSKMWLELAQQYESAAWITMEPLLRKPLRRAGYAMKNG